MANNLQFEIEVKAKLAELDRTIQQMVRLRGATEDSARAAFGWDDAFKFAGAEEALRRIVDKIQEVPQLLLEAGKQGVEFNAFVEKARVGVAAMLRQFDPAQFQTFNQALAASGPVLDSLKDKAIALGVPLDSLAEQYEATIGAMFKGGVRDLEKQIELTTLLRQATQGFPFPQNIIQRDIIDLLSGRAQQTILGRTLGISDDEVKKAQESGKLFDYLKEHLAAFAESSEFSSQTFSAALQRMSTELQVLKGEATTELFSGLKADLQELNKALASEDAKTWARTVGTLVGGALHDAENLLRLLSTVSSLPVPVRAIAGAAVPGADALFALSDVAAKKQGEIRTEELIKQRDKILEQVGAAKTLEDQQKALAGVWSLIDQTQDRVSSGYLKDKDAANQVLGTLREWWSILQNVIGTSGWPIKTLEAMRPSQEQLEEQYKKEIALEEIQVEMNLLRARAKGDEAEVARLLGEQVRLATIKKELAAGRDLLTAESAGTEVAGYAQEINANKTRERDLQLELTTLLRQEENLLQRIHGEQQLLAADPYLSAEARQLALHNAGLREEAQLLIEIGKIEAEIKKIQGIGGPQSQAQIEELTQKLDALRTRLGLVRIEMQKTTAGGQLRADLADWVNGFGTASHQIAQTIEGTINAALQGTNRLLLDSVFRTGDWRQTLVGVEEQILQLFLTFIEQQALQALAAQFHITTTAATQTAAHASALPAASAHAAAEGVSSWGLAAAIGLPIVLGAIALIEGAFHEGGVIGNTAFSRRGRRGGLTRDERLILALENEVILTPEQAAHVVIPPESSHKFSSEQLGAMGSGFGSPGAGSSGGLMSGGSPIGFSHSLMEQKFGRGPAIQGVGHFGLVVAHGGALIAPDFLPHQQETRGLPLGYISGGGAISSSGSALQFYDAPGGGFYTYNQNTGQWWYTNPSGQLAPFPGSGAGVGGSGSGSQWQYAGGISVTGFGAALNDYWQAVSQYGAYGTGWYYDASGDPVPIGAFGGAQVGGSGAFGGGSSIVLGGSVTITTMGSVGGTPVQIYTDVSTGQSWYTDPFSGATVDASTGQVIQDPFAGAGVGGSGSSSGGGGSTSGGPGAISVPAWMAGTVIQLGLGMTGAGAARAATIGAGHAISAALAFGLSTSLGLSGPDPWSLQHGAAVNESAGTADDLKLARSAARAGMTVDDYLAAQSQLAPVPSALAAVGSPLSWTFHGAPGGGGFSQKKGTLHASWDYAAGHVIGAASGYWAPVWSADQQAILKSAYGKDWKYAGRISGSHAAPPPTSAISKSAPPITGPSGIMTPAVPSAGSGGPLLIPSTPAVPIVDPSFGAMLDDLSGGGLATKSFGRRYHGGGLLSDERHFIGQLGEFMQPKRVVDHYGVDTMEAIRNMRVPIDRIKLHDGGPLGDDLPAMGGGRGGAAGGAVVQVFNFTDVKSLEAAIVNSDANKIFVVDTLKGTVHEVGINAV